MPDLQDVPVVRDDEASNEAATPQELDVIVESPFSKVDEDAQRKVNLLLLWI